MNLFLKLVCMFLLPSYLIYPVGAGLALYRFNKVRGLEFLLVKDPYQRHLWRQGFEFPAGTIGDCGHMAMDQLNGARIDALPPSEKKDVSASCYLRGAVREGLEELVFIPAKSLVEGYPYKGRKINKNFERKAINEVAKIIKRQGLICLRNLEGSSNYSIFFWNVTDLLSKDLLLQMQYQRAALLSGWFSRASSIGAEPDCFAWVSAQELQKVITKAQREKNLNCVEGTYGVVATELVKVHLPLQRDVPIKLSPGFVGLISRNAPSMQKEKSMSAIIKTLQAL